MAFLVRLELLKVADHLWDEVHLDMITIGCFITAKQDGASYHLPPATYVCEVPKPSEQALLEQVVNATKKYSPDPPRVVVAGPGGIRVSGLEVARRS
jgi:hypothetical protein